MAGVKGRSGGARPNSGPKPKPRAEPEPTTIDEPLAFLLEVMKGSIQPSPEQLKAATAAAQYMHAKRGEGGKKDERATAAKVAAKGKFAPAAPPLKLVGQR